MMRILFCNIAWMKEYRGNEDGKDIPLNGGSYVDETGDAHEKYNFTPVNMEGREGLYCLEFFETKSHNGKDVNQMRIENIAGCELLKKEESVDDVLVVYCAKHPAHKFTTVVGWYKHATVFRHYQEAVFAPEDIQYYKDLLLERKEILRSNGFINKLQPRFEAICERLQEIDNETQKKLWGEVVLKDSEDEDIDFSFRDTSENVFQEALKTYCDNNKNRREYEKRMGMITDEERLRVKEFIEQLEAQRKKPQ